MRALCQECIEEGKDHPGGYALMTGCEVPPQAPPVNVGQMVTACREFGQLLDDGSQEDEMADEATIFEQLKQAVMDGDEDAAVAAANAAVAAGVDPQKAIMEGLAAGMAEMGRLYEEEECYVPELMVSSEALYAGLGVLQPLVTAVGRRREARAWPSSAPCRATSTTSARTW